MNQQSKFPPPPIDGPDSLTDAGQDAGSMIQRAIRNVDLSKIDLPPVPKDLPAKRRKAAPAAGLRTRRKLAEPAHAEVDEAGHDDFEAEAVAEPVAFPARRSRRGPAKFKQVFHPVDRQQLRDQGMIVPEGTVTRLLEEFRIVKRQLLLQAAELRRDSTDATAQRILVCSPHPGEGKTYCAVNLALSIAAEKETEVLLVDADFAKPSVLSTLGLPGGPGLMDALADTSVDVADFVIGTDVPGLWVLPAGNATNSDSEYLSSSRTSAVLDRLTEGAPHRMVIFDSPPALAASPAAELAKYVGQALVIARADRTGQGALEDAITLLSGCPNIQLLLNATSFSPSGRRFGSYYGYGG